MLSFSPAFTHILFPWQLCSFPIWLQKKKKKNHCLKLITSSCKPFPKPPPQCCFLHTLHQLHSSPWAVMFAYLSRLAYLPAELLEDRGITSCISESLVPIQHFISMTRMNKTHIRWSLCARLGAKLLMYILFTQKKKKKELLLFQFYQ